MKIDVNKVYKIADTIQMIVIFILIIFLDLFILFGSMYSFYHKGYVLGCFLFLVWVLFTLQIVKDYII